ncbi:MAG: hypothetical protein NWS83_04995 [Burkholderiaceae bacterium]|nr:hypothetical protein [Burkholderiaceae bacterium]
MLTGRAHPSLLHSYSSERRAAAKGLVEFDHTWSRVVGARGQDAPTNLTNPLPRVAQAFVDNLPFTCGLTIQYEPSALVGPSTHQALATGFDIGMRLHSAPVVRLADARPLQLGHVLEADARFRLFVFAPAHDNGSVDPSTQHSPRGAHGAATSDIAQLCHWLAHDPASPMLRHRAPGEDLHSVIDTRVVFQQHPHALAFERMPELLRPAVGRYGLCDYEKVLCASPSKDGDNTMDIFDLRGINRSTGCMVVVRPDQHVGHILPIAARNELAAYFAGILTVRNTAHA